MKCALLFSGGKDSAYAGYLAKKCGLDLSCLVALSSKNLESYMFHTPSISKVHKQAEVMEVPLILVETLGEKESELEDLKNALIQAKEECGIEAVVSGAVESAYQASRIQRICLDLELLSFHPLWQFDQMQLLKNLIHEGFEVIITGVFAYPLDESWLGRCIDDAFLQDVEELQIKYAINPAGEGGEFESFVLDCPLYSRPLKVVDQKIQGSKNAWSMEVVVE